MRRPATRSRLSYSLLAAVGIAGCDGGIIYIGDEPPDLAAATDLAAADLSPPDFTPPPDLATRPNPLTLWLSLRNGNENALVLVDDPNPPTFSAPPVGVGDSLEASFTGLERPIPAGIWTLYGDGLLQPPMGAAKITTRWDIVWRERQGDGGVDHVIATFRHTYALNLNAPNDAIAYIDATQAGPVNLAADDELVLRITPESGDPGTFFEPNGDGLLRNGKIPHFNLPL